MIPVWLTPRLLKAGALVAVLGLVAFAGWKAADWRGDAIRYKAELADVRTKFTETERARDRAKLASEAYQNDLQELRNRPAPTAPVRLCVRPSVPTARPAEPGSDGAAAPGGVVPGGDGADPAEGPDIRPDINALMQRVEEEMAKLRALQRL